MSLTISARRAGDVVIVDFSGRLVLGEQGASLRNLVSDLLSKGNKKVLFNLADVDHIDTPGLGYLLSALLSVRKQQGELKLLNLTKKVDDVMQITKLYTVFEIFGDETAATRSFGQSASATA